MKKKTNSFVWDVFDILLSKLLESAQSVHRACNRLEITIKRNNNTEIKIIIKDMSQEDRYTREELVRMLEIIRTEENIQNWKVPEPEWYEA